MNGPITTFLVRADTKTPNTITIKGTMNNCIINGSIDSINSILSHSPLLPLLYNKWCKITLLLTSYFKQKQQTLPKQPLTNRKKELLIKLKGHSLN